MLLFRLHRAHSEASPPDVLYEIGRQVQKTALVMCAHVLVQPQQLCVCGRLPIRLLPVFGLRCEIACREWDVAAYTMRKLLDATSTRSPDADRAVGRATVTAPHPESSRWRRRLRVLAAHSRSDS